MPILPINNLVSNNLQAQKVSSKKTKFHSVSMTGYGALGFGTASVIAAANKKLKSHKYLGYIAGALAFLHTGIILGMRFNRKKEDK